MSQPLIASAKVIKLRPDGTQEEQKLSDLEQQLASQLAELYVASQHLYRMYKRNRYTLWASVAANVVMLAMYWL